MLQIAEIRVSSSVEMKLRHKHRITGNFVRSVLVMQNDVIGRWSESEKYGVRYQVRCKINNKEVLMAYLYPLNVNLGIWNLGSAWIQERN